MNEFKYCPSCKSNKIRWINNHQFCCHNCGFVFFKNVASSVAVLLKRNNEILFCVRNQEPKKGFLDLPGGFVDPKETAEQTCQRELLEELGVCIPMQKFKYLAGLPNEYWYKNILYNTLDLFFLVEYDEAKEMKVNRQEIQKIVWVNKETVPIEKIGFDSMKKFFKSYSV